MREGNKITKVALKIRRFICMKLLEIKQRPYYHPTKSGPGPLCNFFKNIFLQLILSVALYISQK